MNQFTPLSHLLEEPPHEQATEYEMSHSWRSAWLTFAAIAFVLVAGLLIEGLLP